MKTLLIDGNNLVCRAYFVSGLTDQKGRRTSGIFGTMKMVPVLLNKFSPDNVVVCWDDGKSESRLALYPEYKKQRDKNRKPEDVEALQFNREVCQKLFKNLPVKQVSVRNVEADDIIGYLCEKIKGKKIVVSNDQDFFQLVNENVSLYLPNKPKLITPKNVESELGFPVKYYILWKSMVGDSSDNIKGIHGIGPAKATKIIKGRLAGAKKLPIAAEEMAIIQRNKDLIAIGALLQPDEVKKIRTRYKKEREKQIDFISVKHTFMRHDFKTLTYNFDTWRYPWDKLLRKGRNGIVKKSKH